MPFFRNRQENGIPVERRVRFDRTPLGPNGHWHEESPVQVLVWSLTLVPKGEEFFWLVQQTEPPLSSSDLSRKIAVRLAEHHQVYNKHYENRITRRTG